MVFLSFNKKRLSLLRRIGACYGIVVALSSCNKINIGNPITEPDANKIFSTNSAAAAALTGIYTEMVESSTSFTSGKQSIGTLCGLTADELVNDWPDQILSQFHTNTITSSINIFWQQPYQIIYASNAAIEGLNKSTTLTPSIKNQLLGEAIFIRSFIYFYLVNLYGDIPLVLNTDYKSNAKLGRENKKEIYTRIITDLKEATNLLSNDYLGPDANTLSLEKTRPNKWTALALLARVYLYQEDYNLAEKIANSIISESGKYKLVYNLNQVFLKNSDESIWQLQPVMPNINTFDGDYYILTSSPNYLHSVTLSSDILLDFDKTDKRLLNWISSITVDGKKYYFPFKYKINAGTKPLTEYITVFRLSEQYLIRAEARINNNNIEGALQDINLIRSRAGILPVNITDLKEIKILLEKERRLELFSEWGHRWLDLRRWKGISNQHISRAEELLSPLKKDNWQKTDLLYPIPSSEIMSNPNIKQNPGYN